MVTDVSPIKKAQFNKPQSSSSSSSGDSEDSETEKSGSVPQSKRDPKKAAASAKQSQPAASAKQPQPA